MKALYRRYRPTKLSDVIGQEQVTKVLEESLKAGKISHAYLFTGPRGCGKTSVARILAHEVNGFQYKIEDNYTDIIEIDAASNTGVDNIRDLIEKTIIAPSEGKYKVYIIDEVHMLSKSAFNALLKTLEEPPEQVIFIMATTDAYKVPITISSRSQVFHFQLANPDVMFSHLKSITKKEKINITDEALAQIVQRGGGSFRDSISLLDQISALDTDGKQIDETLVLNSLGIPDYNTVQSLLNYYKVGDIDSITKTLKELINSGLKTDRIVETAISEIVNNPEPELIPLLSKLTDVKDAFPEAKLLLAFLSNIPSPTTRSITTQPSVQKKAEKVDFSWKKFLADIHRLNNTISFTLNNCEHKFEENVLTIYTKKKIQNTILSSEKNLAIIKKILPKGIKIQILDNKQNDQKDEKINKISDIMGDIQEVNTDGVPF